MSSEIVEIADLNHPDREASVKLVLIDDQEFVLKTDSTREIAAQKYFNNEMATHDLPSLQTHTHAKVTANQLLLEYVKGSPTLGNRLTEDGCFAWGALVRKMHAVTTPTFSVMDENGERRAETWQAYMNRYIETAVAWQRSRPYSLGEGLITKAEQIVRRIADHSPEYFSLTHGDLHVHNVLIKDKTLILFDKFADFLMAPAGFDLGVIYAEGFAGAAYPELGFSTTTQQQLFRAFCAGYGPLPSDQQEWIDHFALLRAFYRWPNRFAPHSGETIRLLVDKLA